MAVSRSRATDRSVTPSTSLPVIDSKDSSVIACADSNSARSSGSLTRRNRSTSSAAGTSSKPVAVTLEYRSKVRCVASKAIRPTPNSRHASASFGGISPAYEARPRSGTSWRACSTYRPSVRNTPPDSVRRSCPFDPVNPHRYRTFGSFVTRNASTPSSGSREASRSHRLEWSTSADDTRPPFLERLGAAPPRGRPTGGRSPRRGRRILASGTSGTRPDPDRPPTCWRSHTG